MHSGEAILTPVDETADIQNGGEMDDDVDLAEQVPDSQESKYVPPGSQELSSSEDSEDVDWEALSQELVESEDSLEVKSKKREKDGEIKITSLVAKRYWRLKLKIISGKKETLAHLHPSAGGC